MVAAQVGTQSEVSGTLMQGSLGTLLNQPIVIESQGYRDIYAPRRPGAAAPRLRRELELGDRGAWPPTTRRKRHWRRGRHAQRQEAPGLLRALRIRRGRDSSSATASTWPRRRGSSREIGPVVGVRSSCTSILMTFASQEAGTSIVQHPVLEGRRRRSVRRGPWASPSTWARHISSVIDTGIRYQTAPQQFDFLPGLTKIDDSDGRWTAPVVGGIGFQVL